MTAAIMKWTLGNLLQDRRVTGFQEGMLEGRPPLEPVMDLKVPFPTTYRRYHQRFEHQAGARYGMNPREIPTPSRRRPLSEVQRYTIDLKSMTQGRATYTLVFDHYEEVPANITQKLVAARQAEMAERKRIEPVPHLYK